MAGKKKKADKDKSNQQVVEAEYRVSMHCNACERSVVKAISKVKGVEEFMTDMTNHKVVIIGRFDPQKVLKKLKKKTGKKVELVVEDEDANNEENEDCAEEVNDSWVVQYYGDTEIHMMFNDENANSCSIM